MQCRLYHLRDMGCISMRALYRYEIKRRHSDLSAIIPRLCNGLEGGRSLYEAGVDLGARESFMFRAEVC